MHSKPFGKGFFDNFLFYLLQDKMASEYARVKSAVNSSGDGAPGGRDGTGGDTAMELGADSAWMTT